MFHHPSNESRQRHSDEQRGLYDRRQSDLTRFSVPEPITTPTDDMLSLMVDICRTHAQMTIAEAARHQAPAIASAQRERDYEEAMRGLPEQTLSPADLEQMAQADELQEGRSRRRSFPTNFHE